MLVSYLPALPLGMEGKEECLEFKSQYLFENQELIRRLNKYAPRGIRFFKLRKLEDAELPLNKNIKTMVYSLDLGKREIRQALEAKEEKTIEMLVDEFLSDKSEYIEKIPLDKKKGKLFFYLKYSPQKSIRPQDIVKKIFEIENSVFFMARERIIFKSPGPPIER